MTRPQFKTGSSAITSMRSPNYDGKSRSRHCKTTSSVMHCSFGPLSSVLAKEFMSFQLSGESGLRSEYSRSRTYRPVFDSESNPSQYLQVVGIYNQTLRLEPHITRVLLRGHDFWRARCSKEAIHDQLS